jgi:hypothetical protein
MRPPWIERPDIPHLSLGWRMGWGESYMNEWIRFFASLPAADKVTYIAANPAPGDWPNWYRAVEDWARTKAEDEAWMASHKANENTKKEGRSWWKFWK